MCCSTVANLNHSFRSLCYFLVEVFVNIYSGITLDLSTWRPNLQLNERRKKSLKQSMMTRTTASLTSLPHTWQKGKAFVNRWLVLNSIRKECGLLHQMQICRRPAKGSRIGCGENSEFKVCKGSEYYSYKIKSRKAWS